MPADTPDKKPQEVAPLDRSKLLAELVDAFSEDGIRNRRRAQARRTKKWHVAVRAARLLRVLADTYLAFIFITLLSPLLLILFVIAIYADGGIRSQIRLGRWAKRYAQYEFYFPKFGFFQRMTFLRNMPALYNVLICEMSFIGPRPIHPEEIVDDPRNAWKRYDLRPGLLSLSWIRKRANIAHTSELSLDLEYIETKTFWGDLGIALRAIPTAIFTRNTGPTPPIIHILGIRIDNLTMSEASERIVDLIREGKSNQVCFTNADCMNISVINPVYRAALAAARITLADGIGIRIAGAMLDQNVCENVNGTDMFPFLCAALGKAGMSIYLLGGKPGISEAAAAWITEHHPAVRVAGYHHGYFSKDEEPGIIAGIRNSKADIMLLAFGAPRQDIWISEHLNEFGTKVAIGVGGLLDFYSGRIPRAPIWLRELGLEWFYRFYQEPGRMWKRYFVGNGLFLYRVFRERLRNSAASATASSIR
ncbi:N-acetylglucosaminyldiphosphoundecaprenol N-acetyl-beta-D-mannosaminyltransferase [Granulicella pectinivorans]|jgi:N-acetylglucosaminyldiphosphoundecaprenol N-acetyl-beta-D-mannosaminyltransferase|uniref:N-acetylglucosaminyldiphosphoundecaprenol N-acetyl-beta-D-mannosaminyltransferase n=1 Tax=Granulicella pectinivorans TaxID=474950 RepID=A0A1I6LUP9_9BACT|nr:WecB/TagA/CpsF family glycosyltransferase [Granulicella pectinivorans]SFS07169.1 N-acetylglucosaminyldiphosphoundecaprenol N-acetyl-beta-D-mannosaminyltransferase [Granulicella pectinivorans]